MSHKRAAIVLAAGKGKRMKSDIAKVLHPIAGKPIIEHVIATLGRVNLDRLVVVIGHQGESVREFLEKKFPDRGIEYCWQREQLGTGHAVQMARVELDDFKGATLVTPGDVPFMSSETLENLFIGHEKSGASATCLSATFPDPYGYGRIVRANNDGMLDSIVEEKDATDEVRRIHEINSGIFVFDNQAMFRALDRVTDNNAQGEYYLTDVIKILGSDGKPCFVVEAENPDSVRGINSADQLLQLERMFAK